MEWWGFGLMGTESEVRSKLRAACSARVLRICSLPTLLRTKKGKLCEDAQLAQRMGLGERQLSPALPSKRRRGRERNRHFLPLGTVTVVVAVELLPEASVDVTVIV